MNAVLFRFTSPPNHKWIGLAVSKTEEGLIDLIDAHGDPYSCEIFDLKGNYASICMKVDSKFDEDGFCEDEDYTDIDTSGSLLEHHDLQWQTPPWSREIE